MAKAARKAKRAVKAKRTARTPRKGAAAKAAPRKVSAIPKGYHSATPYLTLNDATAALDFYARAFGARELMRLPAGDGRVGHAEIRIGDSVIMLGDEMPGSDTRSPRALGGTTASVMLYVPNVDAMIERARQAGATVTMPAADMFWGDRFGTVQDPFGHKWALATHKQDLTPKQVADRARVAMAQMGQPG